MKAMLILGVALGAPALTTPIQDAAAPAAAAPGSIRGVVTFDGARPETLPKSTIGAKESEGCCEGVPDCVDSTDRTLLVDEKGGICNVVVTLTVKGQTPVVPKDPIVLDQKGCNFEPHVVVVPVGGTVEFKNSDGVNHNIHTYSRKNKAINNNIAGGASSTQVLDKDEDFDVKCDIHPWMLSRIYVTDATHWGVSGVDGGFVLEGVPPGTYTLQYWHERLGKGKSVDVTVASGAAAQADFKIGEKEKKKKR